MGLSFGLRQDRGPQPCKVRYWGSQVYVVACLVAGGQGGPDVPFPAQVSGYLGAGSSHPSFWWESRGERRRRPGRGAQRPVGQSVVPPAPPAADPTMIMVVLHSNDPK